MRSRRQRAERYVEPRTWRVGGKRTSCDLRRDEVGRGRPSGPAGLPTLELSTAQDAQCGYEARSHQRAGDTEGDTIVILSMPLTRRL
jgi:hypothetical protein